MSGHSLELWRSVNVGLAVIAFVLLAHQCAKRWAVWSQRMRLLCMSMLALIFTIGWSSLEAIQQGLPYGQRSWMTTGALLWIVAALIATPQGYYRDRR